MDEKDDSSESEEGTIHLFVVFESFARRFCPLKVMLDPASFARCSGCSSFFVILVFFCLCFELLILSVANAVQFDICVFCNREYGRR